MDKRANGKRRSKNAPRASTVDQTEGDTPAAMDTSQALSIMRSEGQRLLSTIPGTLEEIARSIGGASRQTILNWRTGSAVPSPSMRRRLFTAFSIPPAAWSIAPGSSTVSLPPESLLTSTPNTLDDCLTLHSLIRRARNQPGLLPSEMVKLADTEARVLALRHRLEKEAELLEDRIVREHPKWQAIKRGLARVIAGCPRCAKAITDELQRLDM